MEIQRNVQRYKRFSIPMPQVSIVGYTNVGKSTLLNALTDNRHSIYADDKLFATLDPMTKRVKIGSGSYILISDTVGFINELPHLLIAAFHSTLNEIKFSDLIIHLHDITNPSFKKQSEIVRHTLREIGVEHIPVINVFNKVDFAADISSIKPSIMEYEPILISAKKKTGLNILMEEIENKLSIKWKKRSLLIPYKNSSLINKIRDMSIVKKEEFTSSGIMLEFNSTDENYKRIKKVIKNI